MTRMRTAGVLPLLRLAVRRDRIWLACWLIALPLQVLVTASSYRALYPTTASLQPMAASIRGNVAFLAVYGPAFAVERLGGLTAWRVGGFAAVLAGLMGLLTVLRHTRAEEETGRLELLRSARVGRHASLAAALLEICFADLLLWLLLVAVLTAEGLGGAGAVALGAGIASCGLVFACVGALTAQLATSTRSARGLAVGALVLAHLLRAVADGTGGGLSVLHWLSPVGWAQQVRPYAGERYAVLALPLLAAVALALGAAALEARRDLGAGLLPERRGPARGRLRTAYGLAWRLQRGSLLAWTVGMAGVGAAVGLLARSVGQLVEGSPEVADVMRQEAGQGALLDAFFGTVVALCAIVGTIPAVQAVLRVRGEETAGHLEVLAATGASRSTLLWSHAGLAALTPVVLMAAAGLGAGVARAVDASEGSAVSRVLSAALAQVPAMEVVVALALALVGLLPRLAAAAWVLLAGFVILTQVGALGDLPDAVTRLSPYSSSPSLPADSTWILPVGGLLGVSAVLALAGRAGFLRRDLLA